MATVTIQIHQNTVETHTVEVTPDFCFERAARILLGQAQDDPFTPKLTTSDGQWIACALSSSSLELMREWRELGVAIAQHGSTGGKKSGK